MNEARSHSPKTGLAILLEYSSTPSTRVLPSTRVRFDSHDEKGLRRGRRRRKKGGGLVESPLTDEATNPMDE